VTTQYYFSNAEKILFQSKRKIIDRLHRLTLDRKGIGIGCDMKYRVEFLSLAFKHDLVDDIISYRLWDAGWEGLGERQFDCCFEMGDSEYVIADLVQQARNEGFLDKVQAFCNPEGFQRWLSYADRQLSLI